jgi:phosphate transport system substrate-binding protein
MKLNSMFAKAGVVAFAGVSAMALAIACAAPVAQAQEGDHIQIVGSSTVYPFSSAVAEHFGATTDYQTPVVESTGSGGGHKLFGAGVGANHPDLTNSSRRMKVSEFEAAQKNGVEEITEAMIGYDGISIAQNIDNEPMDLTLEQLALAVAAEVPQDGELVDNPYMTWSDIDSSLPDRDILVLGPPSTSGTRDAFEELVLEVATEEIEGYDGAYTKIRTDGLFIPSGENDNLIVAQLARNTDAVGIFGYSFLAENQDKIQAIKIDGVDPTPDTISSGEYPVSRSLFFYIKNAHVGVVPGLKEFVDLFMSEQMIGPRGELKRIGLIPLPEDVREAARERVEKLNPLKVKDGELTSVKDYMEGDE